ncbi:MAG: replication-associated recombination protein A, partial [Blautia sp.]|nr:replication-associated recombination protein A [Blautia sp.]
KGGRVPVHLMDAHYQGHERLGHGVGYLYPHDYPGHYVRQQYLPEELIGETFYEPSDSGYEKEVAKYLASLTGEE